jgi:acyl transferase domain-containing protein
MRMPEFMSALGWHQVAAGNDKDFIATQASFRFGLRGPSVNVQAACSTSLLAVALACDALVAHRCDAAVAGGVSIATPQRTGYVYAPSGIASSDGKCRAFDAAASGSVLGNGVGAVILKRVTDALAAGDRIYAVIRGVGVNNDGHLKSSFAAPSVKAQSEVIAQAIALADIGAEQIGYVEAHGTATAIGDPIEVAALGRALAMGGRRSTPCGIGSVKSNIGHLDPAAGVASLIKTALSLHNEVIPASLHYKTPNPAIDFLNAGVKVIAERTDWPRTRKPRIAGISSFGIGGTNVHAILTEAPLPRSDSQAPRPELLALSAKTETALQRMRTNLANRLMEPDAPSLSSCAFTLALGRGEHKFRTAVVAASHEAAVKSLRDPPDGPQYAKDRRVVFLYPGQGRQQLRMGLAIYRAEPLFRGAIDEVFEVASPLLGFDARAMIDPETFGDGRPLDVAQTALAQPLLFATQVAMARLWESWGITPDQQLGHSVGELSAAALSGVFTVADATRIVVERGRLMQSMSPGAMLAVSLDESQALALEDRDVRVAAFNGPLEHTISGSLEAIDELERRLSTRNITFTRLGTSHAFHHASMQSAADSLKAFVRELPSSPPQRTWLSGLTGGPITVEEAQSPEYWSQSIVQPVRFSRAARALLEEPGKIYVECGVGRVLGGLMRAHGVADRDVVIASSAPHGSDRSDNVALLEALGQVWQAGVPVDFKGVWRDRQPGRAKLPGYPFEPQRYWIDEPRQNSGAHSAPSAPRTAAENTWIPSWAPATMPQRQEVKSRNWLILTDPAGLGAELAACLRTGGERVILVRAGSGPVRRSDLDLTFDPTDRSAFKELASELPPDFTPVNLLNLWPTQFQPGPVSRERLDAGLLLGYTAPLRILRELAASGMACASLTTISSRLFALGPSETVEPVIAPTMGLVRVLPQETGGMPVRLVDILPPTSPRDARRLIEKLSVEVLAGPPEPVIAYRSEARLAQSFQPLALPDMPLERLVRPDGVYLITGGFGGIGGVLAKALVEAGARRIALIGRHGPGSDEAGLAASELVLHLEGLGAVVAPLAADVADLASLSRAVGAVEARLGRIAGAVHAAGVPGGRMLLLPEAADVGQVLAPKLQGAVNLLSLVGPHQPDFVMLCSSFASVSGGVGQGEYAAANAFLDTVASYGSQLGLRTTAIGWPAWREVGMAHKMTLPPELEHMREASLRTGIGSQEGAELFARVLAAGVSHAVIAPYPDGVSRAPSSPVSEQRAVSPAREAAPDPRRLEVPLSPIPPSSEASEDDLSSVLRRRVEAVWKDVLGVPAVGRDDNFFEIGGQSLMALRVVMRVGEQFGTKIGLNDVLDHPRLDDFCDHVFRQLSSEIEAMPGDLVQRELAERAT